MKLVKKVVITDVCFCTFVYQTKYFSSVIAADEITAVRRFLFCEDGMIRKTSSFILA